MNTEQIILNKGDWIIHVFYGLGQIISKDNKILEGQNQIFLKVKTCDSLYWIPTANIDKQRIRPLASKNQFKYALSIIQRPPKKLSKDYMVRKKEISQSLNKVSLLSKVRMIRDLHARRISTKFNLNENAVLENMKEQFLDECALVMAEDRNSVEKKLYRALKVSTENV